MSLPSGPITRDDVFRRIAHAVLFGHLGLFVGTGFSKALTRMHAPSFEQLLRQAAQTLSIPFNFDDPGAVRGASYPQLAAKVVDALAKQRQTLPFSFTETPLEAFKLEISRICNLQPDLTLRAGYAQALADLKPSWIVTTNYDFILEHLIEDAVPLLPYEAVNSRRDSVPVYHLHGHRLVPNSIVVTEEDYVELLGPAEYRQLKLSLLLTESTTLMLGYSLGDINVRAAMKLSRTFPQGGNFLLQPYQGLVVQALFVSGRGLQPEPITGPNSEIIIEISDILQFLQEILVHVKAWEQSFNQHRIAFSNALADPQLPQKLVIEESLRKGFAQALKAFPRSFQASRMVQVLHSALEPVWTIAQQPGNWHYYAVFLSFVLDILSGLDARQIHPILTDYLAQRLATMAQYIDPSEASLNVGKAWDATQVWRARKGEIPPSTIKMLKDYAQNNRHWTLNQLLEKL